MLSKICGCSATSWSMAACISAWKEGDSLRQLEVLEPSPMRLQLVEPGNASGGGGVGGPAGSVVVVVTIGVVGVDEPPPQVLNSSGTEMATRAARAGERGFMGSPPTCGA